MEPTIVIQKTLRQELTDTFIKSAVATAGVLFTVGVASMAFSSKTKDQDTDQK